MNVTRVETIVSTFVVMKLEATVVLVMLDMNCNKMDIHVLVRFYIYYNPFESQMEKKMLI